MKVAIVGSRDWKDRQQVIDYVWSLPADTEVISGGADGVDTYARGAANARRARVGDMDFQCIPAFWDIYGNSAGLRQNGTIVALADRVVAFWDGESKGTAHTIKLTRKVGKPLEIHYPDGRVEVTP